MYESMYNGSTMKLIFFLLSNSFFFFLFLSLFFFIYKGVWESGKRLL